MITQFPHQIEKGNFVRYKYFDSPKHFFGGKRIWLSPHKTTTIAGILTEFRQFRTLAYQSENVAIMGENQGGINILNAPEWMQIRDHYLHLQNGKGNYVFWKTVSDEFWREINLPWIQQVVEREDHVRFVSNPRSSKNLYINKNGIYKTDPKGDKIPSIFSREVNFLIQNGYQLLANGTAFKVNSQHQKHSYVIQTSNTVLLNSAA